MCSFPCTSINRTHCDSIEYYIHNFNYANSMPRKLHDSNIISVAAGSCCTICDRAILR